MATSVERVLNLPPEPASASKARRAVRELLVECGQPGWVHDAELAVSELVTNVVLHAHSPLLLRATCGSELRVEVWDESPVWPTQRGYGEQATTGRGMGLIAALSRRQGTRTSPGGGKTVWFVIGDAVPESASQGPDAWADGIDGLDLSARPQAKRVLLLALPCTLWLAVEQRHDALLRELALDGRGRTTTAQDLAAAEAAASRLRAAVHQELAAARARGDVQDPLPSDHPARLEAVPLTVDAALSLAAADVECFAALQDVLDEAERRAAASQMLSRPGLPEVIAVRDWACEQVIAQLNGQEPSPWGGSDAARFTDLHDHDDWPSDWDSRTVSDAQRGLVAATTGTGSSASAARSPGPWAGTRVTWSVGGSWRSCPRSSGRRTSQASPGT